MQGRYDKKANVYDQVTAFVGPEKMIWRKGHQMLRCATLYLVGSFIEFVSRKLDDDELTSTVIETTVVRKNAFTILTSAANHAKYLPDKRKEIINKTRM